MTASGWDVIVIGAGAAGLMATIFAGGGERRVLLLERTSAGGKKILISGGGRCNVLPSQADPARFITGSSPHSVRNILRSWPLAEQRAFFERDLGLPLAVEEETGKLFPVSNRARQVRDLLVTRARRAAEVRMDVTVTGLRPPRDDGNWQVELSGGDQLSARSVVVATGGLSVPATGSDGTGLAIARALGHTIHRTYPALTPLVADPPRHSDLAGVSLTVSLTAPSATPPGMKPGGFLFTHRGYSGPSVLDISHAAVLARLEGRTQPILVQWTEYTSADWTDLLAAGGAGTVAGLLRRVLPDRLADMLVAESGVPSDRPLGQLRRDERDVLVRLLTRYPLPWTGDEGYKKAEVTGGGVALSEIHPGTMESRRQPGLFLCGEMLDAFGPIGGHNFLWAWATGRAAGLGAARASGASDARDA